KTITSVIKLGEGLVTQETNIQDKAKILTAVLKTKIAQEDMPAVITYVNELSQGMNNTEKLTVIEKVSKSINLLRSSGCRMDISQAEAEEKLKEATNGSILFRLNGNVMEYSMKANSGIITHDKVILNLDST